jgi:hypothetical protein
MRVFVSDSHDSREHERKVLGFTDQLRADGIDAVIDQYVPFPEQGWPRWTEHQIASADFVLLVCTAEYRARFDGQPSSTGGLGVVWEGNLISQHIYNAATRNTKFIPILPDASCKAHIPTLLQGVSHYLMSDQEDKHNLFLRLTDNGLDRSLSWETSRQSVYDHGYALEPDKPSTVEWDLTLNTASPDTDHRGITSSPSPDLGHMHESVAKLARDETVRLLRVEQTGAEAVNLRFRGSRIGFEKVRSLFRSGRLFGFGDISFVRSAGLDRTVVSKWQDIADVVSIEIEALPQRNLEDTFLFPMIERLFRRPAFYAQRERDWRFGLYAVVRTRLVWEQQVMTRLRPELRSASNAVLAHLLRLEETIAESISLSPSKLTQITARYISNKEEFIGRLPRSWQFGWEEDTKEGRRQRIVKDLRDALELVGIRVPNLGEWGQDPDQPLEDNFDTD